MCFYLLSPLPCHPSVLPWHLSLFLLFKKSLPPQFESGSLPIWTLDVPSPFSIYRSCLNSILCGIYILGSYAYLPPLLHPCPLSPLNPCNIYTLTFTLTLNLPFKASSFPSLFEDNASPTSSLTTPPCLTPCKFCLKYIMCCVFVCYHLNPCHPLTFTLMLTCILMPPLPFQFKSVVLPVPLLVVSFSSFALRVLAFVWYHPYLRNH